MRTTDVVGDRSAALFNNRYVVAVVTAVAARGDSGAFTTRQIAKAINAPDSLVRPVLLRLLAAGFIQQIEREGGPRSPRQFRPTAHAWPALQTLCQALARGRQPPTAKPSASGV